MIYITSLLVVLAMSVTACDVLNEDVVSGITSDQHYTTPEGFRDAVNASYEHLRYLYGNEQGGNLHVMGTDIITNGGHGGFHYMNEYSSQLNSEAYPVQHLWDFFYQGINTTNTAINRGLQIPDEEIDEEVRNTLLAEARFLRAHMYFTLVQHYGPVHLTLEETVGVETEAHRAPESDVYAAIVEDLEFAIDNLPPQSETDWGRATWPAAEHQLALVLLTRGHSDFAGSDDFSRAFDLASDVINNSDRSLQNTLAEVFDLDNQQNDEVIFSVQFTEDPILTQATYGDPQGNQNHVFFRPWYETFNDGVDRIHEPGYGRPWIRFRPTTFAMELFHENEADARYEQSFQDVWYFNNGDTAPDGAAVGDTAIWVTGDFLTQADVDEIRSRLPAVDIHTWHPDNEGDDWYWDINMFPNLTKVDDWNRPAENDMEGSRDFILYRLAETYLIAAEALIMDNRASDAVFYVNEVRRRAAHSGMEAQMEVTAAELDIDFILDERAREFYGEQKRWLDLKRTGRLLDRVREHNAGASPNIEEHHLLRPIPATQLNRTLNDDFTQNPGY